MNILGCLDRPTAGTYSLAGTPVERRSATTSWPGSAAGRSASSSSRTTCCRGRPRSTTSRRPCCTRASRRERVRAGARAALERLGLGDRARPRAERALRRPAAAGRGRAGARHRARADPRRRADRQPRQPLGRGGPGAAPGAQRGRPHDRPDHPRRRRGGGRGSTDPPARRADRGMSIFELLGLSLSRLRTSRLRAALTMLGVVIGVASVVALVGVGRGTTSNITNRLSSLGTNLLTVSPTGQTANGSNPLTLDGRDAIAKLAVDRGRRPRGLDLARGRAGDQGHDHDDRRDDRRVHGGPRLRRVAGHGPHDAARRQLAAGRGPRCHGRDEPRPRSVRRRFDGLDRRHPVPDHRHPPAEGRLGLQRPRRPDPGAGRRPCRSTSSAAPTCATIGISVANGADMQTARRRSPPSCASGTSSRRARRPISTSSIRRSCSRRPRRSAAR